jgi:protein O-mannosyl-transferase
MRNGSPLRERVGSARTAPASSSVARSARAGVARRLAPAVIALVVLASFAPALAGEFVSWDDAKNFLENTHYRGLAPANLAWMWSTFHLGHYIPLTWMTLGLDYSLWGMNPAGYHATSIVIHAANAVLCFFVARRLFAITQARTNESLRATASDTVPAAFVALLFAIHPLRVESVAWITERRDVLSLFFMLVSTLAYLRWIRETSRQWYAVSLVAFLCALLSKATAMTLPVVFVILNLYPLERVSLSNLRDRAWRRVALELAPFAVLSLATVVLSIIALHPPAQLSLGAKGAVSAYSLAFYLWKTAVPLGLAPLYEMPQRVSPTAPMFVLAYTVSAAFLVGVWMMRRRWLGGTVALAVFLVVSLPTLGIVQNGPQIAADRYTYHAAPALAFFIASAVFSVLPIPRSVARVVAGAVVVVLSLLTVEQSRTWRDTEHLWTRVLAVDSNSAIAHSGMASLAYKRGNVDGGMQHSLRAVSLAPNYPEAHNDVGVGFARQGRLADAAVHYRHAIELQPTYDEALNNLGVVTAALGDLPGAVELFRRALAINPDYADAHVNWGNALVRVRRLDEAIPHYQEAIAAHPDHEDAYHNWGVALAQKGELASAIERFRQTLAINPNHAEARLYLDRATQLMVKR